MSSWPSFSMYIGRPSYVCVLGKCELDERAGDDEPCPSCGSIVDSICSRGLSP